MSTSLARPQSAYRFGFAVAVGAGCATYVDEPLTGPRGSMAGAAGSDTSAAAGNASAAGSLGVGGSPTSGGVAATGGAAAGKASAGDASGGVGGSGGGRGGNGGNGGQSGAAGGGGRGGSADGGSGGALAGNGGNGGNGGGGTTAGGAGGAPMTATCAKNPIPAKSAWVVTASHSRPNNLDPVGNVKDGELDNRWTTGRDQTGDEWLQIDFGVQVKLTRMTLVLGASAEDYPRQFAARFSLSSQNFAAPVLDSGAGAEGEDTVIDFAPAAVGRYLLISQGGMATALWWSVAELQAECAD